ncbi:MAG: hypothetical protein Q9166_006817 [cf. Caloplaca sp. 2 TL-2023]
MPPASPSDQQSTADDHSPLSDKDVGILYQIITGAEQDSNVEVHPFRAIFTSYDTVLAQHELSPDHDQIYLRFLLRLGENRQAGETLYQSFEALLAELGIQIEINNEQNEIQDVTRSVDATARNSAELQTRSEAGSDSGIRSRRASFHSLVDAQADISTTTRIRLSSRASIAGLGGDQVAKARDRPSTRASIRPSERTGRQQFSRQPAPQQARGRLTAREFANNLQHVQRRHVSASTTRISPRHDRNTLYRHSRTRSDDRPLVQEEGPPWTGYDYQDFTPGAEQLGCHYDRQDRFSVEHDQSYQVGDRELFYRPTGTQLLRDADSFLNFRLRALLRNALNRWRVIALDSQKQNERMSSLALNYDSGILLRQSFDQWRVAFQLRVQVLATERYFEQLGQRAHKARGLYLLTKAFTHWQQITNDKINHATHARRHVLSVKYFNAWLELTVVNHRKVQLQGQRKFYNMWNRRYVATLQINDKASLTRRRNLTKAAYWKWFWAFCERRAPQWKDRRLQSAILHHWSYSSQRNLYREYEVTVRRDKSLKKVWFSKWLQQARSTLSNAKEAEGFRQQKITANSLLLYRRTVRHAPLARQVSNMTDWRIAGSTFAILVNRLRTEHQATKVNWLRSLRNAWTAWNDRLRLQTLEDQIDDRVLVQALYRWVLAERCVLLQRLCEQRSMHRCLRKLVDQHRARVATQKALCDDLENKQQARISKVIIDRWRRAMDNCNQDAQVAFEFEVPRVAQEAISAWTGRRNHIRNIDKSAVAASYYFRTVRSLRRWRAATVEAKRQRYREAYAHIRRNNKMKLANNCLQIWRHRARYIIQIQVQAQSNDQRQLLHYGTTLFDHWRNRHDFLKDRQYQTILDFDRRFAHNQLDKWMARYRTQAQLQELASMNAELRISNIAFSWLHKLHLRVIEVKGRESNADSLRRWYEKRHFHNLLHQWRERLAKKRNQPPQVPVHSSRARRLGLHPDAGGQDEVAGHAEDWTAFDEDFNFGNLIPPLDAQTSSTPLLNTPSKRAHRAQALVKMTTTPVGTPSATGLGPQIGRGSRSVRRNGLGRSNADFGRSAFRPIQEASPRTPEKS